MVKLALSVITALAIMWAFPVRAAEPCMPLAEFKEMLAEHPEWTGLALLTPEQIKQAVEIYNAIPPETDSTYAVVWLVDRADGVGAMVLGSETEACVVQPFSADDFQALKRSLGVFNS